MQAHPDPYRDPARPVVRRKRALRRHAAPDRVSRRLEHDEKLSPSVPISCPPCEENAARNRARCADSASPY
jgi:hypothetical protein